MNMIRKGQVEGVEKGDVRASIELVSNTSRLRNSKQSFLTEFQEFQLCHLLKIGRETGLTERY